MLISIEEEMKNPVKTGFFVSIKSGSPYRGAIPFIKANCRIIEE